MKEAAVETVASEAQLASERAYTVATGEVFEISPNEICRGMCRRIYIEREGEREFWGS